nr:MAG TPA: hypothetical protein [Caudoviricetes sp.]DAZ83051.1 MAG TPA: hypothetical protein [Caudoviricetes sp.]
MRSGFVHELSIAVNLSMLSMMFNSCLSCCMRLAYSLNPA